MCEFSIIHIFSLWYPSHYLYIGFIRIWSSYRGLHIILWFSFQVKRLGKENWRKIKNRDRWFELQSWKGKIQRRLLWKWRRLITWVCILMSLFVIVFNTAGHKKTIRVYTVLIDEVRFPGSSWKYLNDHRRFLKSSTKFFQ